MRTKRTQSHPTGNRQGASCQELLRLLNDYVDGAVKPATCRELEAHLAHCDPCRVVVDNVRKTITLYRNNEPCELPAAFRQHLHSVLRKCWKKNGPPAKRAPRARA